MKKKLIAIVITAAVLLSMPGVLLAWGFALPVQYGDTFLGGLNQKVQLLKDTAGPRIVLAGGSGAAFGADSTLMERELPGYSVVNFGMYAALGTTVMLDLSQPFLRAGDIVLLIPEQQEQTLSGWFDPAVMWQGLDGSFDLLRLLPRDKLERLAGTFPSFAGQKFAYFLRGQPPRPEGVYRRDSFNEKGDVFSPLCARNEMPGGFDASTPIRFGADMVTEEFARRVRDYAQAAAEAGAVLWYAPCPMNAEEQNGALTVTGLTGEGLAQTALTVPSAWEGKPVSAIGPGAFRGADALREITIQPNIRTIADGAFDGCAALERIVLQSPRPSACRVGQGLLNGTGAEIRVPREALSAYRTDYFWSVYGGRIRASS